jgi:glutathione S-transferase
MKLYGFPASPNTRKVQAVAAHLDMPLEFEFVDITKGKSRTPEFLKMNPNGRTPVFMDGDFTLWESNAIMQYLASQRQNDLWPDDARTRALQDNRSAVQQVETKIDTLKKRRTGYDKELEFYQDKKGTSKPPAKLLDDIDSVSVDLKVQEELLAVKKKEVETINAKYDQDKKRYLQLTRQSR